MNIKARIVARIALMLVAVALMAGLGGHAAGAQPIDINSGSATVARALCTGTGGNWNITNNVFFCTNPDGHGWACDMDTNPIVCWNFMTVHPVTGTVKGNIGATKAANVQVQPSSGTGVNAAAAQAAIANVQVGPAQVAQPAGRVVQNVSANVTSATAP